MDYVLTLLSIALNEQPSVLTLFEKEGQPQIRSSKIIPGHYMGPGRFERSEDMHSFFATFSTPQSSFLPVFPYYCVSLDQLGISVGKNSCNNLSEITPRNASEGTTN